VLAIVVAAVYVPLAVVALSLALTASVAVSLVSSLAVAFVVFVVAWPRPCSGWALAASVPGVPQSRAAGVAHARLDAPLQREEL
jgi:hypothetical protein